MSLWPTPRTYAETDAGDRYGKRLHLPKSELASFEVPNRGFEVKDWPLRNRLAVWTTFLLTVMLIIFGVGSGWFIYQEQLEGFREMRGHPTSAIIIRKEAAELIVDLARAYLTAQSYSAPVPVSKRVGQSSSWC
jgi:hypothetical protein